MISDYIKTIIEKQTFFVLTQFYKLLENNFDFRRIIVNYIALNNLGINLNTALTDKIYKLLIQNQQEDGGYKDVKDSLYAIESFKILGLDKNIADTMAWVNKMICSNGGIKLYERDISRMPLTALVYETCMRLDVDLDKSDLVSNYIVSAWDKELKYEGLTFKAGRFLSALKYMPLNLQNSDKVIELKNNTIKYLENNMQADGGFSQDIILNLNSSPYVTSIVLNGLISANSDKKVIKSGLEYLDKSSLKNGGWKEHEKDYITACIINNLCKGLISK